MYHQEFAQKDAYFISCCGVAGIQATRRQASKFRRKMGLAYKKGKPVIDASSQENKEEVNQ